MLAEITLTSEMIVFIGTVIAVVVSMLFYFTAIDKRVAVLESNTLTKEEFYKKMDEFKSEIVESVKQEIRNVNYNAHENQ